MYGRKWNQARYLRTFLTVGAAFLQLALSADVLSADLEILPEQGYESHGLEGGPFPPFLFVEVMRSK